MDDTNRMEHESFGLAYFIRTSHGGATPLFGSSIKHRDTMTLCITKAVMDRDLSHNWPHGTQEILELEMSKSQFADLVSCVGQAPGVPVTIRRFNGQTMEDCPYVDKRIQFTDEFKALNRKINANVEELIDTLQASIDQKKPLSKAEKEECLSLLTRIHNDVQPNAEYKLHAFQEQMDKTVTEAKAEIEAFFENKMLTIAQNELVNHVDDLKIEDKQSPVDLL